MAIVIELKRSSVPGKVPTTTELALGELAINTYDGKLYLKKNVSGAETIVDITSGGGGSGSGTVTSVGTAGSVNGITLTGGPITSAGTVTLGGTLSNILNNQLANSSLTIGSTNISLGGTVSTLTGLTSVTATNFIGNIVGSITSASYAGTSSRVDTSFIDTNTDYYVTFVEGTSDGNKNLYSDTSISYNPNTNLLSTSRIYAVQITGSLFGTASFATTASFLSGSVTSASYAGTSSRSILTKVLGAGQYPIIFAGSSGEGTGSQELYVTGSDFSYLPQTNTLNIQNLNGTASFATTASFARSASFSTTASFATSASFSTTASFALTSSFTNIGNSIINNADNRILTATGGNTINGEANLTFDGSTFTLIGNQNITGSLDILGTLLAGNSVNTGSVTYGLEPNAIIGGGIPGAVLDLRNSQLSNPTAGAVIGSLQFSVKGDTTPGYANAKIDAITQINTGTGASGGSNMRFFTSLGSSGALPTERMRITASGSIGIGKSTPNSLLDVLGNAIITGSLTLSSSAVTELNVIGNTIMTGSLTATQPITGSLFGTASFATTASFAETSSLANIATTITTVNNTGDAIRYLVWAATGAGNRTPNITTTRFVVNSATGSMGIGKSTIASGFNLDVSGSVLISGSLVVTSSVSASTLGQFTGNNNGFVEFSVRNSNNGVSASSDIAVYNNSGSATLNHINMGINSSGIASGFSFGRGNDSYVYNTGGDLFIGNNTAFNQPTVQSQSLHLFANSAGTPNLTITGSRVGIQKSGSLNATLDVSGSVIITGSVQGNVSALTISSNTASINLNLGNFFTLTLSGTTHLTATNIKPGQTVNVLLTTDTYNNSVTFNSTIFKQPSGLAYTPTQASDAKDILTFVSYDTTNLYVVSVKNLV